MRFGAELLPDGGTRFRLWAPGAGRVELRLHDSPARASGTGAAAAAPAAATARAAPGTTQATHTHTHIMQAQAEGWYEATLAGAPAGTRYRYVIDGALEVPDPASRSNPEDVSGPSCVVDPLAYEWQDEAWRGRPWQEAVIYELHIGAFTPQGSYDAAARELPALARLGITAIELMPLADFPGQRGWGYDGVLAFAPDAAYGPPEALKRFVDQAHALGLMVLLDVVYNHFGPAGNYLHAYCPAFFDEQQHTPWGAAINFDGAGSATVREFYLANALYWTEEYHFDGLRLDAVHAIRDRSAEPIVCAIGRALRAGPGRERAVHLVLENADNSARWLARDAQGAPRCADAQWNDDWHHAAHVLLTGERDGYYADYGEGHTHRSDNADHAGQSGQAGDSEHADHTAHTAHTGDTGRADRHAALDGLGRALAEGFIFQGQASAVHGGAARGEPSTQLPPIAFVAFLQNHDQIGNRALGERLSTLADAQQLDTLYACLLLAPAVPLLFMGEEWAATTPFLYFCDFHDELAQAVTNGRRAEFARFAAFADAAARTRIPDPNEPKTFAASVLQRAAAERAPQRERRAWIARLLALRHRHLVPRLPRLTQAGRHALHGLLLEVAWPLADGSQWRLQAHFGAAEIEAPWPHAGEVIFSHGVQPSGNGKARYAPNAVRVWSRGADA